jgi:cytochrome c peroxidase
MPVGIPADLWRKLIPASNPMTTEKVALGQQLYFDKGLSLDGTMSCATCHDPATGYADRHAVAIGMEGKLGMRNAPTILNAIFQPVQFWDGRAHSLEEQAKQPLLNPSEMGMKDQDAVVARVNSLPEYSSRFRRVFGAEGITFDTIVKAIAAFERSQLSGNAPFDHFLAGNQNAITETQKQGWRLFHGKAQCIGCHAFKSSSPFFTDFQFHNTGIAARNKNLDQLTGRMSQEATSSKESNQGLSSLAHSEDFSELGRYLASKQRKDVSHQAHNSKRSWLMNRIVTFLAANRCLETELQTKEHRNTGDILRIKERVKERKL